MARNHIPWRVVPVSRRDSDAVTVAERYPLHQFARTVFGLFSELPPARLSRTADAKI